MKPKTSLVVLFFIALASCGFPAKTAREHLSVTQTAFQLPSPEQTGTPNLPAIINTPTQISVSEDCDPKNNLQQMAAIGKIVFYEANKGLYLYNPQTNQDSLPLETTNYYVEPSPDQRQIFVYDYPGTSGELFTSNGNKSNVNIEINGIFYGWLNNQQLEFVELDHSDGSVIILDIETRKVEQKITHLTDVNFDPIQWYAGGSQPSVIFDNGLSRLVYTSIEIPSTDQPHLGFILRDYDPKSVLWSKQSSDIVVKPKWSPDGKYVAVVITNENNDQIYILDRDGNESQIIDTNTFGISQIEWSPSGKRIGFNTDNVVTVYDLATKSQNDYKLSENIYNIVWSPNSDQLAVKGALIDFSTNCIFPLKPENKSGPLAWLFDK